MNSLDSLRVLYFRYKETPYYSISIFLLCLLIGIVLILRVIIPQFDNWFSINTEVEATRARVKILNDNISLLSSQSDDTLSKTITVTSDALPFDKSFTGIVDALSSAANDASVSISDYGFNLGELSTPSAQLNQFYKVPIHITVYGDIPAAKIFIQKLNEKIPLSEVESWDGSTGGSNISLIFYYKGFPNILLNDLAVLQPISAEQQTFLQKLQTWRPVSVYNNETSTSTASAEDTFTFPF